MTAVIIDDEYLAIKVLEEYALQMEQLSVEKTFTRPEEALEYLKENRVDVILLDIQMPRLNGFELLGKIADPPLVIFTTARHDYAVQAFELDVLDYLVKPISFDRFQKAIARAEEYLSFLQGTPGKSNFLMIRADHRIHKVMTEDIEYIEGLGEYVKLFTVEKMLITYAAMKDLVAQLPPNDFIRIHKSYIVSVSKVASFTRQTVTMRNNKELPIGRLYKQNVMEVLSGNFGS